jgi:hypothetical protein
MPNDLPAVFLEILNIHDRGLPMNQLTIKKTMLATAISMAVLSPYAIAAPDQLPVTNMLFDGVVYNAGGLFNSAGTVGSFDPSTDLVPDGSGGRTLAPSFDPLTASGNIYSFDKFFGHHWEGAQQSVYLTNKDAWANCTDTCDSGANKGSGPLSAQGQYDYDDEIAAMTDEQIAIGMFFNWNMQNEIAVLEIFDCDANDNCTGNGIPMANGPFAGSVALFNAGLSCKGGFSTTGADTPLGINITEDVLGIDTPPSNCVNPTAVDQENPAGLKVDSAISPTASGGTAIINGDVIDYTPLGGFEGSDSIVVNVSDDTGGATALTYRVQVGGELKNNFSMLDKSGAVFGGTNDVDIVWDESSFNTNDLVLDAATSTFTVPTDTNFGVMTIGSPEPFFNFTWVAHHVRIFKNTTAAAITYSFDVTCLAADYDTGVVDCNNPLADQGANTRYISMTLEPGEMGGHILFDWGKSIATTECGKQNCNIDVVNKWTTGQWDKHGDTAPINTVWIGPAGVPPATVENSGEGNQANWVLVSGDVNSDGINASPMVDGAFVGSYANFNYKPDKEGTPLPPHTGKISDVEIDGFSFSLWTIFTGMLSVFGLRRLTSKK